MLVLVETGPEAVDHATQTEDLPLKRPTSVSQASTAPSLRVDEEVEVIETVLSVYVTVVIEEDGVDELGVGVGGCVNGAVLVCTGGSWVELVEGFNGLQALSLTANWCRSRHRVR